MASARLAKSGSGWLVELDGQPQSFVDLADPRLLAFEYVQHFATIIDSLAPGPLAVTHVGGGGLSLARYIDAERPGSTHIVLEPNAELTALVRRELPLPRAHRIRVRPIDGLRGLAALRSGSADVVVLDAYANGRMPAELTTTAYLGDCARVLRRDGVLLANVADEPGLRFVARFVAGVRTSGAYADCLLVATHEVLKGRRFGNVVVVAGRSALDEDGIRRAVARSPFPTGVRFGAELTRWVAGARPFSVDDAEPSPEPPDPGRWRVT